LIETLYRERFGLSWQQMQDEPAEAVGYWLLLERERTILRQQQAAASHER